MAEGIQIPVTVPGGAEGASVLRAIAGAMDRAAGKTKAAGDAAAASSVRWTELWSVLQLGRSALEGLSRAADRIGELASEEAHLSAASRTLGLDFDAAASATERFTDETVAMHAAEQLAAAGVRINQEELNNLIRVSAVYSQRTGTDMVQATEALTEAILSGSVRSLRAFGPELARTAGEATSAEQRLDALGGTAVRMGSATDDAATAMLRFRDSIEDTERTAATAFSQELLRLQEIESRTDNIRANAADAQVSAAAAGRTAADMLSLLGNLAFAFIATVALGLRMIAQAGVGLVAGFVGLTTYDFSTARAAFAAIGGEGNRDIADFVRQRLSAAGDTFGAMGEGGLPEAPPPAPGAPRIVADMVFDRDVIEEERLRRARRSGGRGHRREDLNALMGRAFADRGAPPGALTVPGEAEALAQGEQQRRFLAEESAKEERRSRAQEEAFEAAEREKETLARQSVEAERQTSIVGRLETTLQRYGETSRHVADIVVGSLEDMTAAWGSHLSAVIEGREGLGEALQGMLADTLKSIGKRAGVSAMEEAAAALASLAYGNLPAAGLHAAAAVGFTAVAAAAGYAGSELAPTASAPKGAPAVGQRGAADVAPREPRREQGTQITVNFGAPVIAAGSSRAEAGRFLVGAIRDAMVQQGVRIPETT